MRIRLRKVGVRGAIAAALLFALAAVALVLPLLAHTSAYPVAIVEGNSMYPTLHNGDLVFFRGAAGEPRNGSIVVFVQGQSGYSALDSLLHPVVIHRIVSVEPGPGGSKLYQTKGDNNQARDPFLTDSRNVMGVVDLDVPYVGFPFQFLQTPYGLVVAVALISILSFAGIDTEMDRTEARKRLLAAFSRRVLDGEWRGETFDKLRAAVEYFDDLPPEFVPEPPLVGLFAWLREGGLDTDWQEEPAACPTCAGPCARFGTPASAFVLCGACLEGGARRVRALRDVGRGHASPLSSRRTSHAAVVRSRPSEADSTEVPPLGDERAVRPETHARMRADPLGEKPTPKFDS